MFPSLYGSTARRSLIGKRIKYAYDLLEEMMTAYLLPSKYNALKKTLKVHELEVLITLSS